MHIHLYFKEQEDDPWTRLQVAMADRIILNKVDLLAENPADLEAVSEVLTKLNGAAPQVKLNKALLLCIDRWIEREREKEREMYVCIDIDIYIEICRYIDIYTHTHIYVCVCESVCVCRSVDLSVCLSVCLYICVYIYVYIATSKARATLWPEKSER